MGEMQLHVTFPLDSSGKDNDLHSTARKVIFGPPHWPRLLLGLLIFVGARKSIASVQMF